MAGRMSYFGTDVHNTPLATPNRRGGYDEGVGTLAPEGTDAAMMAGPGREVPMGAGGDFVGGITGEQIPSVDPTVMPNPAEGYMAAQQMIAKAAGQYMGIHDVDSMDDVEYSKLLDDLAVGYPDDKALLAAIELVQQGSARAEPPMEAEPVDPSAPQTAVGDELTYRPDRGY